MDDVFYRSLTHRTELVIGPEALGRLASAPVIVFGVGGVGSWCAEALVRTGVRRITVVDSDVVCATNLNRQCQTLSSNIGAMKAEEMKKRMLQIDPGAEITALNVPYGPDNWESFRLGDYLAVVDAIDSLSNKLHLLETCVRLGVPVFSSMGAAARTDPARIRIGTVLQTSGCPLAREVRRGLRKRGVDAPIPCVYSDEPAVSPAVEAWCGTGGCVCEGDRAACGQEAIDWCSRKKQINGALAHITGTFGFFLAGMVVRHIVSGRD